MEGILVKTTSTYHLVVNDKIIASKGDSDGKLQKLSLKNCEAVANGYDLDELAKIYSGKGIFEDGYDGLINPHTKMFIELAYIKGFQKALEILGDKKFSADEIIKAYNDGWSLNYDYFQSLQQTEWDVEICCQNDCYGDYTTCKKSSFECQICTNTGIPKLDEDGCLILRRK